MTKQQLEAVAHNKLISLMLAFRGFSNLMSHHLPETLYNNYCEAKLGQSFVDDVVWSVQLSKRLTRHHLTSSSRSCSRFMLLLLSEIDFRIIFKIFCIASTTTGVFSCQRRDVVCVNRCRLAAKTPPLRRHVCFDVLIRFTLANERAV